MELFYYVANKGEFTNLGHTKEHLEESFGSPLTLKNSSIEGADEVYMNSEKIGWFFKDRESQSKYLNK